MYRPLAIPICALLMLHGCGPEPDADRPPVDVDHVQGPDTTERIAPPRPLVVATWNIEWLTDDPPDDRPKRTDADYARLAGYAARMNADLVFLQEVEGPTVAARVFDPAVYDFLFTRRTTSNQKVGLAYRKGIDVEQMPDLEALGVGRTRLRWGLDVQVRQGDRAIRFLGVHLKSGCFSGSLDGPDPDCARLHAQLPIVEGWIDARSADGLPAIVIGDFNRRLGPDDAFWRALDDGEPVGSRLTLTTEGRRPACWNGRYSRFIDHFVLNTAAARALAPESFRQWVYDGADAAHAEVLSDHCPLTITLEATRSR